MSVVIGVDVGGTFTDFFVLDTVSARTWVHKTSSTPANPSQAIATGLEEILGWRHFDVGEVSRLAHGTTVATNALIQRQGAPVALFVTEGFREARRATGEVRHSRRDGDGRAGLRRLLSVLIPEC